MVESLGACVLAIASAFVSIGDWNDVVATSAPLNWYRLDETNGVVVHDYGSQGLHASYGTGVHAPLLGAAGAVGGAVSFDGDRKNILIGGSTVVGDWSAEFVLKKTGTKFSAELLRGAPLASPSSHLKLEQYPNTGQVGFTESFAADHVFFPAVVAPLDEWVHLVYVKSDAGMQAYLNGALAGTSTSSASLDRYQFGDTESESPFAIVDEIVVYGRALSAEEIAAHFRAVPEPSCVALAAIAMGAARQRLA